jgi:hypothetical protein
MKSILIGNEGFRHKIGTTAPIDGSPAFIDVSSIDLSTCRSPSNAPPLTPQGGPTTRPRRQTKSPTASSQTPPSPRSSRRSSSASSSLGASCCWTARRIKYRRPPPSGMTAEAAIDDAVKALTYGGFVGVSVDGALVVCTKPSWDVGTSLQLPLRKRQQEPAQRTPPPSLPLSPPPLSAQLCQPQKPFGPSPPTTTTSSTRRTSSPPPTAWPRPRQKVLPPPP